VTSVDWDPERGVGRLRPEWAVQQWAAAAPRGDDEEATSAEGERKNDCPEKREKWL